MATPMQVFVFGDQTFDACNPLSELLLAHDDVVLHSFLESSCRVLKQEVASLRHEQEVACPRFASLADLVTPWREGILNPALIQALTCICHIGTFLHGHVSGGHGHPTARNACITARCTGLISSIAVGCSSNPVEIASLGRHAVAVAFRVGACAWDVGSRLQPLQDEQGIYSPWTMALAGIDEDELMGAIDRFAAEKSLGPLAMPYVSARIAPSRFSVSAPPRVLGQLFAESSLSRYSAVPLPITAPYHAEHLYGPEHVSLALRDVPDFRPSATIPVISSSTGESICLTTYRDALRSAVEACLKQTIRWDLVPAGIAAQLHNTDPDGSYVIRHVTTAPDGLGVAVHNALGRLGSQIDHSPLLDRAPCLIPPAAGKARDKIAILSMAGRFPRAPSMDAFWHVLEHGIDTHELAPASRWNTSTHVGDASALHMAKNISGTGFGCWLHDAGLFDARFFNMSPREAPQVDPAQRLALLTAAEALEQAGIVPGRTSSTQKDRIGVYFGSTSNDWMETNSAQDIDTYFIPGGNRAFIPGRINYHFKFSGPSYTIDTACSSSLSAIHLACNALWKGEVDTAIVGGTNVLTNPDMTAGLDRGHFLSRTGNCKTFDDTADGYCRGEAVATAVLKRLSDAVADKDPIQACILAIQTNHSAEADSITRPHVGAQQALFENLLLQAGVKAKEITYCEMHGTGTQAGDASEAMSVLQTLAPEAPTKAARSAHERLWIGAAKSNVGHGEAAAGVTSLAKVLLMLKHSTIPPHCGIKTKINHKLPDLAARNVSVATASVQWPRPYPGGGVRKVLLNNFSAAGGNTALILEDAPASSTPNQVDTRLDHVIAVSAKTPASLENNLKNLAEWIEAQQSSDPLVLPRLSYTTTARRIHHPHRVMVLASDLESASASLRRSLERKEGSSRAKGSPRYLFAFTGQGAHYAGMGVDLYSQYSGFRDDIRCYNRICLQLQLPPIQQLFESLSAAYADATPTTLQLASVCFQMALYRLWVSLGVRPSVVVGHSLGEFAALYAASVLSQVDVISLVGRRAQLLEQFCDQGSHAMLAVRTDLSRLESFVGSPGSHYEVSCLNGHENVVLGGTKAQMDAVRRPLVKRGISHTFLEVPYAYHTSQVEPILASLQLAATGIEFREPKIPLISPTYGRVITRSDDLGPDFFVRHCRDKVDMLGALKAAKATNFINEGMVGVEIGPALVVTKMVKEVAGAAFRSFPSCRSGTDSARLLAQALAAFYTAGAKIDWMTYHTDFASSQQVLDLPSYSWDLKEYWIQYVHDWSLRKGEPPLQIEQPALESSSIHRIVQHTASAKGGELVVEADLSRIDLHPMVQGHKVYGVPLCTPSVYADIAFTIGKYLKRYFEHDGKVLSIDIADMNIQSALVANSDGKPQLLRTFASLNPETKSISCTFSSVDDKDKVTEQHSTCLVKFFDTDQARCSLKANASRIKARIASLEHQLSKFGNTFRYSKAMIYKMVGQLADFDPNYRALEEIILDSDMYEAVGRVNFTEVLDKGSFHTNPAYIDALSQLGGFVMNGNNSVDLDKELFVNHGWRSLQLLEAIDSQKIYTTHVKMVQGKDKLWHGDITIFHNDDVIGIFAGVALQGVPKRLMQYIVSSASKRVTGLAGKEPMSQSAQQVVPPQASSIVTKTATKLIEHRRPAKSVTATKAVQIISDESGVSVADLTDETRFDDVGVDSLLSLVVTSRIRDELGIDFDSTVFFDLHTVSDFKNFLLGLDHPLENSVTEAETIHEVSIPINIKGVYTDREDIIADIWTSALNIIAEESGIDIAELNGDTSFSDIGVDSLLSLVVCSRMRDELNVDVPDRSLFLDFPTIGDLRDKITSGSVTPSTSDISTSNSNTFSVGFTEDLQSVSANMEILDQMALSPIQPAWSITLQGSSRRASERLFLFPDGCGAATSYLNLPSIAPTTAVIGFNSPFMKTPLEMRDRQLSEIVTSYVGGVRKHQPHGPYHLAGWSAGGILAYAISQELMVAGEEVASLTLIDSPPPNNGLDRLPRRFFDHCSKVGIFGTEMGAIARQNGQSAENPKLPEWLMPHFEATIELLHDYHAPPMPRNLKGPGKVNIIWAGSCAFGGQYAPLPPALFDSEDTEGMKFLTEQRTDFGPGDWALLFPERNITVDIVQGHHHFSMMRGSGGEQLGHFIRRTLGMVT